jgi:tight adherence protein B
MTAGLVVAILVVGLGGALRASPVATSGWRRAATLRRLGGTGHSPVPRLTAPGWLPARLQDAGVDTDPSLVWSLAVASALVFCGGALIVGGPSLAVLAVAGCAIAPYVALAARRGSGDARLEAALPGALEAVARALRSGASLRQAIGEAAGSTSGPLGDELARVAVQAGQGRPLVTALDDLAGRRPLPGVRLTVAALCLGVETGGAQARAVDGVAATLRDRQAVAAELKALSAQARISALVIGLAPIGFGVFATATDPRTAEFLLRTPAGLGLLVAGLGLDGLGWLWMRRLGRVGP